MKSDSFDIIRAAFSELCEKAIYTEQETGDHQPCQDYLDHLRNASRQIGSAKCFDDLANVDWIAGQAALAIDAI